MHLGRRLAAAAALTLPAVVLTAPAAHAAYYNEYSDVASTPNVDGATAAQGFAAGATYLYSVKVSGDDARSVIYRVDKTSGATVVMTNASDGSSDNTWLGHANDMTIVDIDDQHHLFVVTMSSTGAQLVKLRYDGTSYTNVGSYAVHLDGAVKEVSGISRVTVDASAITFLLKSGSHVYTGSLPLHASSGTIDLTPAFDLQVAGALVDGAPVADLGTFSNQGFFYDVPAGVLYYPLTKDNRSVVLVYRGVTPASTGTLAPADDLSFRITSSKYSSLFEIEGVGLSGGQLYFNTNRSNADGGFDGVHAFKGYAAP